MRLVLALVCVIATGCTVTVELGGPPTDAGAIDVDSGTGNDAGELGAGDAAIADDAATATAGQPD